MAHLADLVYVRAHASGAVDCLSGVLGCAPPVRESARVVAMLLSLGAPRCRKRILDLLRHDLHHVLHALAVRVGDGTPLRVEHQPLEPDLPVLQKWDVTPLGPLKRDASTKSGLNS